MPPEAPSILARHPAGSVVREEGPGAPADQETWVVRRDALKELCSDLRTSPETRLVSMLMKASAASRCT